MFDFSPIQIIIVLLIALAVFGPKRLPEMGRSLGRGLREFRDSVTGHGRDHEPPAAPPAVPDAAGPAPAGAVDMTKPSASGTTAEVDDDEADEVLEGVVVSGADQPGRTA